MRNSGLQLLSRSKRTMWVPPPGLSNGISARIDVDTIGSTGGRGTVHVVGPAIVVPTHLILTVARADNRELHPSALDSLPVYLSVMLTHIDADSRSARRLATVTGYRDAGTGNDGARIKGSARVFILDNRAVVCRSIAVNLVDNYFLPGKAMPTPSLKRQLEAASPDSASAAASRVVEATPLAAKTVTSTMPSIKSTAIAKDNTRTAFADEASSYFLVQIQDHGQDLAAQSLKITSMSPGVIGRL